MFHSSLVGNGRQPFDIALEGWQYFAWLRSFDTDLLFPGVTPYQLHCLREKQTTELSRSYQACQNLERLRSNPSSTAFRVLLDIFATLLFSGRTFQRDT